MRQNRFVPRLLGILLFFVGLSPVFSVPPFRIYGDASFSPTVTVTESNEDRVRLQLDMEHLPQGFTVNFSSRLPGLWENMNTDAGSPHYLPRVTILVAWP